MAELQLTSPAFKHNESIPSQYTCDGDNVVPPLEISGVDPSAESLVLVMDDPDVPKSIRPDGMYDHWVKFNVPVGTLMIQEGKEPEGTSGLGTGGSLAYHGPCPPDREHRYFFKLYSLDTELALEEGATKKDVEAAMEGHIIQQAELLGLYKRK
jgi:hypothetical protein|tara:strand:- start:3972 stop:4433 length:462 start_codon:yes stop_codon:yes gene_type:complete